MGSGASAPTTYFLPANSFLFKCQFLICQMKMRKYVPHILAVRLTEKMDRSTQQSLVRRKNSINVSCYDVNRTLST